jgi:hypothetical protein
MVEKEDVKYLPYWLLRRYSLLYKAFGLKEFSFPSVKSLFPTDDRALLSKTLMDLRNLGWLTVKKNPEDKRKTVYTLNSPSETLYKLIQLQK